MKRILFPFLVFVVCFFAANPVRSQLTVEWDRTYPAGGIYSELNYAVEDSLGRIHAFGGNILNEFQGMTWSAMLDTTGEIIQSWSLNSERGPASGGIDLAGNHYISRFADSPHAVGIDKTNPDGSLSWTTGVGIHIDNEATPHPAQPIKQLNDTTLVTIGSFQYLVSAVNFQTCWLLRVSTHGTLLASEFVGLPEYSEYTGWDCSGDSLYYLTGMVHDVFGQNVTPYLYQIDRNADVIWDYDFPMYSQGEALDVLVLPDSLGGFLVSGIGDDQGFVQHRTLNNAPIWSTTLGSEPISSLAITNSGHLLAGSEYNIFCLTLDGDSLWADHVGTISPLYSITQTRDDGLLVTTGGVARLIRISGLTVDVSLPPIWIPPQGGEMDVTVNLSPGPARDHDVSMRIDLIHSDSDSVYATYSTDHSLTAFTPVQVLHTEQLPESWPDGTYEVRVTVLAVDGRYGKRSSATFVKQGSAVRESGAPTTPTDFALLPVYPNPFNATATVTLTLPHSAPVNVSVYDMLGREVVTLARNATLSAGTHQLALDGTALASGAYFVQLQASGHAPEIQRITLVK